MPLPYGSASETKQGEVRDTYQAKESTVNGIKTCIPPVYKVEVPEKYGTELDTYKNPNDPK